MKNVVKMNGTVFGVLVIIFCLLLLAAIGQRLFHRRYACSIQSAVKWIKLRMAFTRGTSEERTRINYAKFTDDPPYGKEESGFMEASASTIPVANNVSYEESGSDPHQKEAAAPTKAMPVVELPADSFLELTTEETKEDDENDPTFTCPNAGNSSSPTKPNPALPRAMSTDSVDSTNSLLENGFTSDSLAMLEVRATYDRSEQLLLIHIVQGFELCSIGDPSPNNGASEHVWVVLFLLPHPKPLCRTQISTDARNPQFQLRYEQRVREDVLKRLALLCQVYSRQSVSGPACLRGYTKIRLKDVNLVPTSNKCLWLTVMKNPTENDCASTSSALGDFHFTLQYSLTAERITVVVGKLRDLRHGDETMPKRVVVKAFLVQGPRKYSKKKTSVVDVVDGKAELKESIIFPLQQRSVHKVYLRLSVAEVIGNELELEQVEYKTLGHVTVGSRCTDKEFGHWDQMIEHCHKPTSMWHTIRPKRL